MLKYKKTPWLLVSHFVNKTIRKHYPTKESKKIIYNAKNSYKDLLKIADDIGSNNPMAHNMYFSLAFFSYHVGNKDIIGEKELKTIINEFFQNAIITKSISKMNLNKTKNFEKMKKKLHASDKWLKENKHKYSKSWNFEFEDAHQDGFYYCFTACPIAKFFKDNGYEKYTHLFCEIDYITLNLMNAELYRKYTIANGDKECDFWIVPDKIKKPK